MATNKAQAKFNTFVEEKYIPLETKVKLIIVVLAISIPVALCYFFIYKPGFVKIESLNAQVVSVKKSIGKAKEAAKNLPKYEKKLAGTQLKFEETKVLLPKTKEIPNLLRGISDLGKDAGLDFLSFKPGAEIPKDFYSEIPIDISIRGPYHNLGYFLDQVSKLERIVTVDNITMGGPKKEGSEMLLNSKCKLKTYKFTGIKLATETGK